MSTASSAKRILFISAKKEAQPVLSQLRSSGHQVSLVEDLDEAGAILEMSGFDQAVLQGASLESLLEQKVLWESDDAEGWRRSTAAIIHDLRGLLLALKQVLGGVGQSESRQPLEAIESSVDALSVFANELVHELVDSPNGATVGRVDVEDVAEAAAVVVYPSATERKQRLVIDVDPDVAVITTSASRMMRALKNLLEFASARTSDRGRVSIMAAADNRDCVVSVSCDGEGVTRSEMKRLFSGPSVYGGRAGPLALAQEIVDQLNGRMWIESEKGGVRVFMAIPRLPSEPLPTPSRKRRK
ncbi:MAG: sensor histidine kinase [Chloroflexi bacterium]|nr:sensor histidine kinase [Chloroflexota bacterium]